MGQTGFASLLLQIAAGDSPAHIRLAAIIQLKNLVKDHWKPKEGEKLAVIADSDKLYVKENLFKLMCRCRERPVLAQIRVCVQLVADCEFPGIWPKLLDEIKSKIVSSADPYELHAALSVAHVLVTVYKYQLAEKQKLVEMGVDELYSLLYQVALKLVSTPSEETACYLKLIAKSVMMSIYMDVSQSMLVEGVFDNWLVLLRSAFEWPVPDAALTFDEEAIAILSKREMFRMKNAIATVFFRLFHKYGNAKTLTGSEEPRLAAFCKKVEQSYSQPLLELFIKLIKDSNTTFVRPTTLMTAFRFLNQSIRNPATGGKLLPLMPELLNNYAFPKLMLCGTGMKLWSEDPAEFVREYIGECSSEIETRYMAWIFINLACSHPSYAVLKGKKAVSHPVLNQFLQFVGSVIQTSIKTGEARALEAALYVIAKLHSEIVSYPDLVEQIEVLLTQYVLPSMGSEAGIVRMRCCWIYAEYSGIKFRDTANMYLACEKLLACLKDKELPVRIAAALAVSKFVGKKEISDKLRPFAVELISAYLVLISQVDIEELVGAVEELVRVFDKEVEACSVELVRELAKTYLKISAKSSEEDGKENSEAMLTDSKMAAAACMSTIARVVSIIAGDAVKLAQTEPVLVPILVRAIGEQSLEVLDTSVDLLTQYTYYMPSLTPAMWEVYPLLIECCVGASEKEGGWGYEIVREVTLALQNFITRDPDKFLSAGCAKGRYLDLMLGYVKRVIEIAKCNSSELDAVYSIKVLITMMEALKVYTSTRKTGDREG